MSIPAAYLGIILIWSTTPLAVKWSGEGPGYLFGVSARMAIGTLLCLLLVQLLPFACSAFGIFVLRARVHGGSGIDGRRRCHGRSVQVVGLLLDALELALLLALRGVVRVHAVVHVARQRPDPRGVP